MKKRKNDFKKFFIHEQKNKKSKKLIRKSEKIEYRNISNEEENDSIVGIYKKSRNFGFVVPDDKKINTDIFISKSHIGKAKDNQKVVVEITKYPTRGKNAEGIIKEIIGDKDQARS